MQIKQKNFYKLRKEIDLRDFLRVIGLAHDQNFNIIVTTDCDNRNNMEMTHENVDLIEKYDEILSENDIYKTIGFITLESLVIEKVRIETRTDYVVFHKSVIYYKGELENLKKLIGRLGLNPDYWLSEKCSFSKECELYEKDSVTCNNRGGEHCGKWRKKTLEQKS